MNASKIPAYIQHRLFGLIPIAAAQAAGYSSAGISVAVARLESREDVRRALRWAEKTEASPMHLHGSEGRCAELRAWRLREHYDSPLDLMLDVMNNPDAPPSLRIQCAKDALPYCHERKHGTKKNAASVPAEVAAE